MCIPAVTFLASARLGSMPNLQEEDDDDEVFEGVQSFPDAFGGFRDFSKVSGGGAAAALLMMTPSVTQDCSVLTLSGRRG